MLKIIKIFFRLDTVEVKICPVIRFELSIGIEYYHWKRIEFDYLPQALLLSLDYHSPLLAVRKIARAPDYADRVFVVIERKACPPFCPDLRPVFAVFLLLE